MDDIQQKKLWCMDMWMSLREQNCTITQYLKDHNVQSIGVYGYGRLGRHLVWELNNEGYSVSWIMDRRYDSLDINSCQLISPDDMNYLKETDLIIVTALDDYDDIEADFSRYTRTEIMSIEHLIKIYL